MRGVKEMAMREKMPSANGFLSVGNGIFVGGIGGPGGSRP